MDADAEWVNGRLRRSGARTPFLPASNCSAAGKSARGTSAASAAAPAGPPGIVVVVEAEDVVVAAREQDREPVRRVVAGDVGVEVADGARHRPPGERRRSSGAATPRSTGPRGGGTGGRGRLELVGELAPPCRAITERRSACGTCLNLLVMVRSNVLRGRRGCSCRRSSPACRPAPRAPRPSLAVREEELREPVAVEEELRRDRPAEEHVVVEVEEVLGSGPRCGAAGTRWRAS